MGSKSLLLVGILSVALLVTSEVAAKELAETSTLVDESKTAPETTNEVEDSKYYGGGQYGGGYGGYRGGGYGGYPGGGYGGGYGGGRSGYGGYGGYGGRGGYGGGYGYGGGHGGR